MQLIIMLGLEIGVACLPPAHQNVSSGSIYNCFESHHQYQECLYGEGVLAYT